MAEEKEPLLPAKTILPRIKIPLIEVELPEVSLPEFPPKPIKLDKRQQEILRYAIQDDIAEHIPIIGDVAADLAYAEIKKLMTPSEFESFLELNKILPCCLRNDRLSLR